jgi:hypothetical protein
MRDICGPLEDVDERAPSTLIRKPRIFCRQRESKTCNQETKSDAQYNASSTSTRQTCSANSNCPNGHAVIPHKVRDPYINCSACAGPGSVHHKPCSLRSLRTSQRLKLSETCVNAQSLAGPPEPLIPRPQKRRRIDKNRRDQLCVGKPDAQAIQTTSLNR